jgi:hypothetical protein
VQDLDGTLAELSRLLRKDGHLLLSLPDTRGDPRSPLRGSVPPLASSDRRRGSATRPGGAVWASASRRRRRRPKHGPGRPWRGWDRFVFYRTWHDVRVLLAAASSMRPSRALPDLPADAAAAREAFWRRSSGSPGSRRRPRRLPPLQRRRPPRATSTLIVFWCRFRLSPLDYRADEAPEATQPLGRLIHDEAARPRLRDLSGRLRGRSPPEPGEPPRSRRPVAPPVGVSDRTFQKNHGSGRGRRGSTTISWPAGSRRSGRGSWAATSSRRAAARGRTTDGRGGGGRILRTIARSSS